MAVVSRFLPPGGRRRRNRSLGVQFQQRRSNNEPLLNLNAPPPPVMHQQNFLFGAFADSTPTISYHHGPFSEPPRLNGWTPSFEPNSPAVSPVLLSVAPGGTPSVEPPKRKSPDVSPVDNRGRPIGFPVFDYTPHLITVNRGEDIASTILTFSRRQQPRKLCILSANGSIANVTLLRQPPSGGAVSYEGRFEILLLKGTFDNSGLMGVLTLSMSGIDYRVHGGEVAGILTAASPIQIVLGSFICPGGP